MATWIQYWRPIATAVSNGVVALMVTGIVALVVGVGGVGCSSDNTVYSDDLDLSPVEPVNTGSALPADWYRNAVFMEIYVRGYQDSDGDGVGDFRGLIERLDYLAELGIGGIWLMPIAESWDDDHGYAVEDYRAVESDYGTLEDFRAFLEAAHDRGIGVIVDYVMNHSAKENPLFLDARRELADKYDWYVWQDRNPGWRNWSGEASWHLDRGGYYYGVFWDQMPDFNLRNEEVLRFHEDNLRFWLELGVDGFRFDAVGTFVENGAEAWESQEENYDIMGRMREVIDDYENRFVICEEPAQPMRAAQGDACGAAFAFGLNYDLVASARDGALGEGVLGYMAQAPTGQMGTILANHDFFAGDRLIKQFSGDEVRYKLAAATLLTLPGIPFVYYGEEIGLGTTQGESGGDHAIRAPMSWTGEANRAGFTTGEPFRRIADNAGSHNVAAQTGDADSLLEHYRTMIALRKAHPSLAVGDFSPLVADGALAFRRQANEEVALVIVHYGAEALSATIDAGLGEQAWARVYPVDPDDEGTLIADVDGRVVVDVPARSVQVFVAAARAPAGMARSHDRSHDHR